MTPADSLNVTARGDLEIVITRRFDAPRALVYDAMTNAELLQRWLTGPPGWTTTECRSDTRPGGTFLHEWAGPDGTKMSMSGTYRKVDAPNRLVRTSSFDLGCEPHAGEQLETMELAENEAGTTVRITVRYPSTEARDGAIASGMEHGMRAGYAVLDELLRGQLAG